MKTVFGILFRSLCYAALLYVIAGFGSLALLSWMDVCPRLDEGGISCSGEFYTSVAEFGMTAVLISAFTGVPLLLALLGAFFLIRRVAGLRKRAG